VILGGLLFDISFSPYKLLQIGY